MAQSIARCGHYACIAAILLGGAPLSASGLQVEPVSIAISGRSEVIWLSNTGVEPLVAQVRVYRWSQDVGEEQLDPTDALLAGPPMLRIPPGGKQVVRLLSHGTAKCEETFRLKIDEIPMAGPPGSGLRYVLHYSVPVFVSSPNCPELAPDLSWKISGMDRNPQLVVENRGTQHAQLAQASLIDSAGKRTEVTAGLLGYVLPGARMQFSLGPKAVLPTGDGTIEIMVNGQRITQRIPVG